MERKIPKEGVGGVERSGTKVEEPSRKIALVCAQLRFVRESLRIKDLAIIEKRKWPTREWPANLWFFSIEPDYVIRSSYLCHCH